MPKVQDSGAPSKAGAHITTTIAIPADALTLSAPPPEWLSQHNVEAVTGIPARVYLDELRKPGFPLAVTKLGKLRLVSRVEFTRWLRGLAGTPSQPEAAPSTSEGPSADDVLAELGLERKRGRR